MSDEKKSESKTAPTLGTAGTTTGEVAGIRYRAEADWVVLTEDDEPIASLFYTAYLAEDAPPDRPIVFAFNGGPGAASVYLHLGLVGPRLVAFGDDGSLLPSPAILVDADEPWLSFADVVCIDPIGTGFSRSHEPKKQGEEKQPSRFWEVERDLKSIGEAMRKLLSKWGRWSSPVAIAGESYGGFRVARLAKLLPEDFGIGLRAAILISPGIELSGLVSSDYNLEHWLELFPSLAATAHLHGRAGTDVSAEEHRHRAERFALDDWIRLLVQGDGMEPTERQRIVTQGAALLGLDPVRVDETRGRVGREWFCRELLRDQRRYVGWYDSSVTNLDPFPDRPAYAGPDRTLFGLGPTFTAGIERVLRAEIGVQTELDYQTLNMQANESWKDSGQPHFIAVVGTSMDALRYGMALDPHMHVVICHGHYDLVTPYSSADRLVRSMKLDPSQLERLHIEHYPGGHMFYTHAASRKAFTARIRALF